MILECPECGTKYTVGDSAIKPGGRTVRCAKCGGRWHVEPSVPRTDDPAATVRVSSPADTTFAAAVDEKRAADPEPVSIAEEAPEEPAEALGIIDAPFEQSVLRGTAPISTTDARRRPVASPSDKDQRRGSRAVAAAIVAAWLVLILGGAIAGRARAGRRVAAG